MTPVDDVTVTIGDNTVIGAGSVVTKDIPANVVAFGQPCRVYREIGEHDDVYYWRNRMINPHMTRRKWIQTKSKKNRDEYSPCK